MLVTKQNTWLEQLAVWRGSAVQKTWPRLAVVLAIAIAVTLGQRWTNAISETLTPLPFSLFGLALGIFLGFRNNASYDRFWEGRKLWGELVNLSRSWGRQALTLVDRDFEPRPSGRQRELVLGAALFAHVVRQHLRDERDAVELAELAADSGGEELLTTRHRPIAVLQWLADRVAAASRADAVDRYNVAVLEQTLVGLTNVLGACERIKNTPIPGSYSVLIHRIVALYAFGLPFGIVATTGALTPIVVLFIAYAFIGLDAIGIELENPFGYDPNDLPLSTLTRNIEIDLRELLREVDLPPALQPQDGIAI